MTRMNDEEGHPNRVPFLFDMAIHIRILNMHRDRIGRDAR